jgi:hypothetical protein
MMTPLGVSPLGGDQASVCQHLRCMQVFAGAVTETEVGILRGNATLRFPDHKDVSTGALEFVRGVRLSAGLRQGRSYVVHAVAEDSNSPSPNLRTRFCTAAPDSIAPGGESFNTCYSHPLVDAHLPITATTGWVSIELVLVPTFPFLQAKDVNFVCHLDEAPCPYATGMHACKSQ